MTTIGFRMLVINYSWGSRYNCFYDNHKVSHHGQMNHLVIKLIQRMQWVFLPFSARKLQKRHKLHLHQGSPTCGLQPGAQAIAHSELGHGNGGWVCVCMRNGICESGARAWNHTLPLCHLHRRWSTELKRLETTGLHDRGMLQLIVNTSWLPSSKMRSHDYVEDVDTVQHFMIASNALQAIKHSFQGHCNFNWSISDRSLSEDTLINKWGEIILIN